MKRELLMTSRAFFIEDSHSRYSHESTGVAKVGGGGKL
jgi:hypothetical protein